MNRLIRIIISLILIFVWMFVIYNLSATVADKSTNQSMKLVYAINGYNSGKSMNRLKQEEHILRKVAHASVYFVLFILVINFLFQINKDYMLFYNYIGILVCFVYACTDEFHQLFVDGRSGEFKDVLIDTSGALLCCLFFNLIYYLVRKIIFYNRLKKINVE